MFGFSPLHRNNEPREDDRRRLQKYCATLVCRMPQRSASQERATPEVYIFSLNTRHTHSLTDFLLTSFGDLDERMKNCMVKRGDTTPLCYWSLSPTEKKDDQGLMRLMALYLPY